jgi:hypothetical protein
MMPVPADAAIEGFVPALYAGRLEKSIAKRKTDNKTNVKLLVGCLDVLI